jgi:ABC-2 type transport system permease protein
MIRMVLHLFGYDLRAFLRNRQSQFFTLALPGLFLVIFASVFGGSGHTTQVAGGPISTSVYYVPGIIALGIIAACFGNLVASVTAQRERGVLKRRRATPVPAVAVIAGRCSPRSSPRWSRPPRYSASGGPPTAPMSLAAPPWPSPSPW